MIGKILTAAIVISSLVVAAAVYYLQVYYYYDRVDLDPAALRATPADGGAPAPVPATDIRAIDANSSPIRFRACFDTDLGLPEARERLAAAPGAEPLNAPRWFDCFDAAAIGREVAQGRGAVFLGEKNVAYGVDRMIAILEDGRGFAWQQLNDCGELAYDGTQVGEDCPPREDFE